MKKSILFLLVLLGSTVILSSCHKDNRQNQFILNNQEFVNNAASSNMFEIMAGNLAINKGMSDSVKMYGTMMVSDHQKAATEMASLVSSKGWTMPTNLLPKEQANYDMLANLSGAAFDKQFATIMVMSHQQTIALFKNASGDNSIPNADGVEDADLRVFAAGKLPTLMMHLTEAQHLQTVVNTME